MSEPANPFGILKSFEAVKAAYDQLAEQQRSPGGGKDGLDATIRGFVEAAARAGAFIGNRGERRSAQDMLDYWFTQLLASGDERAMDAVSPRLAEYQPVAGTAEDAVEMPTATGPQPEFERSRQIIRLGALARQWQHNDKSKGYLLKGAALEDAKKFSEQDRDIAKLVAASEREEFKAKYALITALLFVVLLLAVLAGVAALQARDANQAYIEMKAQKELADAANNLALQEQKRADAADVALAQEQKASAEERTAEAEAQRRVAEAAAKASEDARQNAERLAAQAKTDTEALSKRFAELQKQQAVLDAAIDVIRTQLRSGVPLRRDELPEVIAELIKPDEGVDIFSDPSASLGGYNSAFLGVDIAAPKLSDPNRELAFEGGRPANYLNYSIVLNRQRRMAFYSAANVDRESLRVLPRIVLQDRPAGPDPRIPRDFQALEDWFAGPDVDLGHLVSRSEISWGPMLPADPNMAARTVDASVNVFPNITPQLDTFNRGAWAALERWTLTGHNPDARRVAIFTGPVFAGSDPEINGALVPRAFWKVAVSAIPTYSKSGGGGGYVVDAFLVPQFKRGTNEKIDPVRAFDPEAYRVPVAEIERLAGLRFADIIQVADQSRFPITAVTPGDELAGQVGTLDDLDKQQRLEAAQDLVIALRDGGLAWSEQQKVISALLAMAQDSSMQDLSATGRLNLLFVLSQVPAATWNDRQAIDLKARARAAVAALEARAAAGSTSIGPQTRGHLARLEANIGYGSKSTQTVYLQFAGLTRAEAVEISSRMKLLGWSIPGEERVKNGVNQVRFNPDVEADKTAAELLAADLRATGLTTVTAVANDRVKTGALEIWLSE